jgi:hypothetical protein
MGGGHPHHLFALGRKANCRLLPRIRDDCVTWPRCMCAFRHWWYFGRNLVSTAKPGKGARIIYGQSLVSWEG